MCDSLRSVAWSLSFRVSVSIRQTMAGNGSDPGVVDGSDLWITWTVSLDLHVRTLLATCAVALSPAHQILGFVKPSLSLPHIFLGPAWTRACARQLSWLAEAGVHSGRLASCPITARFEGCM